MPWPRAAEVARAIEQVGGAFSNYSGANTFGLAIEVLPGDSGDTTTDIANQTVDRVISQGADVIVGAASSAVSFTFIDKVTGAGLVHFSPANTSPLVPSMEMVSPSRTTRSPSACGPTWRWPTTW